MENKVCFRNSRRIAREAIGRVCSNSEHSEKDLEIIGKCFKYDVDPCDLLSFFGHDDKKSVLKLVCKFLERSRDNYVGFTEFWKFDGEGFMKYQQNFPFFTLKDEVSIGMWVRPWKNSENYVIVQLSDLKNKEIEVRVVGNQLYFSGKKGKNDFYVQTNFRILNKSWNFVLISIKTGKGLSVCVNVNGKTTNSVSIQGKITIKGKIFSVCIGKNPTKSDTFKGKIASLWVFNTFLTESQVKALQNSSLLMKSSIIDEKMLNSLEKTLLFSLNIDENQRINASESAKIVLNASFFTADAFVHSLRLANGFNSLLHQQVPSKLLAILLNFYAFIFKLSCIKEIINEEVVIDMIAYKIRKNKYTMEIHVSYTKCLLSICQSECKIKLKKQALVYYLLNKQLLSVDSRPSIAEILFYFKSFKKITEKSIILISNLLRPLSLSAISNELNILLNNYSLELFPCLLSTSFVTNQFHLLEGLISTIPINNYQKMPKILLQTLPFFLASPLSSFTHTKIFQIIFQHVFTNWNKKKMTEKRKEFIEIVKQISEFYKGVTSLVNAISDIELNSLDKEIMSLLCDLVLFQSKFVDLDGVEKLREFFVKNFEIFGEDVLKSKYFVRFLVECFKVSDMKTTELLVMFYAKSLKISSFLPVVEFFQEISDYSTSVNAYSALVCGLIKYLYKEKPFFLHELLCAFFPLKLKENNLEIYINTGKTLLDISLSYSTLYSTNESNMLIKVFLCLLFKLSRISTSILITYLSNLLKTDNISYFANQNNNDYQLSLYCFARITELMLKNPHEISEFLETFSIKTDIACKLKIFFNSLALENFDYCKNFIKSQEFTSEGKALIWKNFEVNEENFELNMEKSLLQLAKCGKSPFSELVFSEMWIANVHFLIYVLLVLPFEKAFIYVQPLPQKFSTVESFSQVKSLLESSPIEEINCKKRLVKVRLESQSRLHMKKIQRGSISPQTKFCLKNYSERNSMWGRVKLLKKPIIFNPTSSILFQESKASFNIDSMIFSDTFICSVKEESINGLAHEDFLAISQKQITVECEQITITSSYLGTLKISKKYLRFICEGLKKKPEKYPNSALPFTINSKKCEYVWEFSEVSEVVFRRFLHKNTAFEIFLHSGKSYLLNCFSKNCCNVVLKALKVSVKVYEHPPHDLLYYYKEKWSSGRISTLDYLLLLNKYSGRSFHDISQYPIFPWVIKSFDASNLNIEDPSIYRDLSYPIGAQSEHQRELLTKKIQDSCDIIIGKCHHGSHYSNGGIILHYLLRIEPFTTEHKIFNGGSFDAGNRIFYSFQVAWETTENSSGDVKELIPQFYSMPQVLENINSENLGTTQNQVNISEFQLPKWAKNHWDFIRKHRKCLESNYVSSNIHKWIDLVFGYQQKGKAAEEAFNVFSQVTYDDIFTKVRYEDCKHIDDQIYHFGQTPVMLFTSPHGKRMKINKKYILDQLASGGEANITKVELKNVQDVWSLLSNNCFLFVFYCEDTSLKFSKYEVADKSFSIMKTYALASVSSFDFDSEKKVLLWKNAILSWNYKDHSLKLHNFSGEIIRVYSSKIFKLTAIHCRNYLFTADFNTIISFDLYFQAQKKYCGHIKFITQITSESRKNLLFSTDGLGKIIIHDSETTALLTIISEQVNYLYPGDLGTLVTISSNILKLFSSEGRFLWESPQMETSEYSICPSGEYLITLDSELKIFDIFENRWAFKGIPNLQFFSVTTSGPLYCVKRLFENFELLIIT